jgi:cysteine-rich repeat protein
MRHAAPSDVTARLRPSAWPALFSGLFVSAASAFAACGNDRPVSIDAVESDVAIADTAEADTIAPPDLVNPTDVAPPDDLVASDLISEDIATVDTTSSDTIDQPDADANVDGVCGDGRPDPGEACDDGNAFNSDGCSTACIVTPVVPQPAVGDVILTELMLLPQAAAVLDGQWIELAHVGENPINLAGCAIVSAGGSASLPETLLSPGARVVVGRSADRSRNGNIPVDIVTPNLLADPTAGSLALVCTPIAPAATADTTPREIDRVTWTTSSWPIVNGRALSLDPDRSSATANDTPESWCPAPVRHLNLDRASPGASNPSCPALDQVVDACTLLPPELARLPGDNPFIFAAEPAAFAVDVLERGLTDLSVGADPTSQLRVELGFGPALPLGATWQWFPASAFGAGARVGTDRYRVAIPLPTPGRVVILGRASRDGGNTWTWCDLDGDTGPRPAPTDPAVAAAVDVLPNPCETATCNDFPEPVCAPDALAALVSSRATCLPETPETYTCNYIADRVDCSSNGLACRDGACDLVPDAPTAGSVVFNEIIVHPSGGAVWLELANRTDTPLLLGGCALDGDGLFVFPETRVLPPRGFAVVAASPELLPDAPPAGVTVDYLGEALLLDAAAGSVALRCAGTTIDTLTWAFPDWSWLGAEPLARSPFADTDASRNHWCSDGLAPLTGSPGAANTPCPGDLVPLQTCRILPPPTANPAAGTEVAVSVRLKALPLTQASPRTDADPAILVEGFVAATSSAPTGGASESWFSAVPDTNWLASGTNVDPAEDRWTLRFRAPAPGTWRLWVRATADGGNATVLCDLDGVVSDPTLARPWSFTPAPSACDPDPCGAAPAPTCNGDLVVGPPTFPTPWPRCVDQAGTPTCTWPTTTLVNCAETGARCAAGACVDPPRPPAPGEIVVSELMIVPPTQEDGEWLELTNPGPVPLDVRDCTIISARRDAPDESWTINGSTPLATVVPARGAITIARSNQSWVNGNIAPRLVWQGLSLDNASDRVALVCAGETIDAVAWDSATWPMPAGTALSLSAAALDALANDSPDAWCRPRRASPNALNPLCRPPSVVPAACALRIATNPEQRVGDLPLQVLVDITEPGLTDRSAGLDPIADSSVAVFVAPMVDSTFRIADARPFNASLLAPVSDTTGFARDPAADRWSATFTPQVVGPVAVFARITVDGSGAAHVCDSNGLVDEGDSIQPILFDLAPGVCVPNPCTTPPGPYCSGSTIIWRPAPGTCTRTTNGTASCTYGTQYFSCWQLGGCDAATTSCFESPPGPNQPGDLVITEVMREPQTTDPAAGEWFEVQNQTDQALDLRGCSITNGSGQARTLSSPGPDVIQPGLRTTFWGSQDSNINGGQYVWEPALRTLAGVRLGNVADEIVLICNGVAIDRVAWSPGWPGARGVAMQLSGDALNADANDRAEAWCDATATYGFPVSSQGSPNTANGICP